MLSRLFDGCAEGLKKLFSRSPEAPNPECGGYRHCGGPPARDQKDMPSKVLLVGLSSSLIKKQFKGAVLEVPPSDLKNDEEVIGVEYYAYKAPSKKVQIWNPSLDPRYHSIVQAYFRGANSVLFFVDELDDLEKLKIQMDNVTNWSDTTKSYVLYDYKKSNAEEIYSKAKELQCIPIPSPDTKPRANLFFTAMSDADFTVDVSRDEYPKLRKEVGEALPHPIMLNVLNDIVCAYVTKPAFVNFFPLSKELFLSDNKAKLELLPDDENPKLALSI